MKIFNNIDSSIFLQENWKKLKNKDKLNILTLLEKNLSKIQHRESRNIIFLNIPNYLAAKYSVDHEKEFIFFNMDNAFECVSTLIKFGVFSSLEDLISGKKNDISLYSDIDPQILKMFLEARKEVEKYFSFYEENCDYYIVNQLISVETFYYLLDGLLSSNNNELISSYIETLLSNASVDNLKNELASDSESEYSIAEQSAIIVSDSSNYNTINDFSIRKLIFDQGTKKYGYLFDSLNEIYKIHLSKESINQLKTKTANKSYSLKNEDDYEKTDEEFSSLNDFVQQFVLLMFCYYKMDGMIQNLSIPEEIKENYKYEIAMMLSYYNCFEIMQNKFAAENIQDLNEKIGLDPNIKMVIDNYALLEFYVELKSRLSIYSSNPKMVDQTLFYAAFKHTEFLQNSIIDYIKGNNSHTKK